MKNFFFLSLLLTLSSCLGGSGDGGSGGGGGGGGDDEAESLLSGLWLSECLELTGTNYRMYFELDSDGKQKGAFLKYDDADVDCSAANDVTSGPPGFDVITEDLVFTTDNKEVEVEGIEEDYIALKYKLMGAQKYTLIYKASASKLFVPKQPTSTNPGSDWSGWQVNAQMSGFTGDHETDSVEYNKVDDLP